MALPACYTPRRVSLSDKLVGSRSLGILTCLLAKGAFIKQSLRAHKHKPEWYGFLFLWNNLITVNDSQTLSLYDHITRMSNNETQL